MELKELSGAIIALLLVGILLGAGILVIANLGTSARTATTATNETMVLSNSTCVATANDYVTTVSAQFINQTSNAVYSNGYFEWDNTGTYAGTCLSLTDAAAKFPGNSSYQLTVGVSYTYGASNDASTAMATTATGVGSFSTWIALIIIIIAAAIIITLVIRSFGKV